MKTHYILFFLIFLSLNGISQDRVELIKPNGKVIMNFSPGDKIEFKNIYSEKVKGKIKYIADSTIFIRDIEVKFNEIAVIYKTRKGFRTLSGLIAVGLMVYLPVNIITNMRYSDKVAGKGTILTAAIGGGLCTVFTILRRKKIKIGKKVKLKYIPSW